MAHGWLAGCTDERMLARVVCQSPPCDLAGRYVYEEEAVRTGTHEHEGRKQGVGVPSQTLNGKATGSCKKILACLNIPSLFLPTDLGSQCTALHQP